MRRYTAGRFLAFPPGILPVLTAPRFTLILLAGSPWISGMGKMRMTRDSSRAAGTYPRIPYPPVAILCLCQGPVFPASHQVSPEQFRRDIPGLPVHDGKTEFPVGSFEAFIQSLLQPCFQGIGSFPDPYGIVRVSRVARSGKARVFFFPDILAPLAVHGIEKTVDLIAGTERTVWHNASFRTRNGRPVRVHHSTSFILLALSAPISI